MTRPVPMAAKVEAYLSFRRGLGYRLWIEGRLLQQFARYADAAGHRGPLTTDLMLRWARHGQHRPAVPGPPAGGGPVPRPAPGRD